MTVAAFVPGLMDRSRFDRHEVVFVTNGAAAAETGAQLVLVDLDRCDDLAQFRLDGVRVVGFCSHVDDQRRQAAEEVGYDIVLARSAFFRRLDELLGAGS